MYEYKKHPTNAKDKRIFEDLDSAVVHGQLMLYVGLMCLTFNLIQMKILHQGSTHYHMGGGVEGASDDEEEGAHGHEHEGGERRYIDYEKDFLYHGGHSHGSKEEGILSGKGNINVSAAFLHALGDCLMSIGVVIAATIIWTTDWYYADPAVTFVFSICVCFTTGPIIKRCVLVIMEGSPTDVDTSGLIKDIKTMPGITSIHDFHIWQISVGKFALSAHIHSATPLKSLKEVSIMCRDKYNIDHCTL